MTGKLEQFTRGYDNAPPLVLIEYACQRREGGKCPLYDCRKETIDGKKAIVHSCNGNSIFCDWIMGIALELSDPRSNLHKKAAREGRI